MDLNSNVNDLVVYFYVASMVTFTILVVCLVYGAIIEILHPEDDDDPPFA